jgi:hypothetical protein
MYQLMALLVMDNNLNAQAVKVALPSIAHGLCHYHYLKEAIKPIYEADRHAKKEFLRYLRCSRRITQAQKWAILLKNYFVH